MHTVGLGIHGSLLMYPALQTGLLVVITETMVKWGLPITGCFYLLFFAKTATLMLFVKLCIMNWVIQVLQSTKCLQGSWLRPTKMDRSFHPISPFPTIIT